MLSGLLTAKIGYYVPAMYLCPTIMAVGDGLMSTFHPTTPQSQWVGYQFLTGFGLGFGMQTAGLAMQTVLAPQDVSTGIAIVFFVQQLGGAVFTSVGQTILSNLLVKELAGIPGLDAGAIVGTGATDLGRLVPEEYMGTVVDAYNYALTRIFLCAMGLAFASLVSSWGMEWRSIKKGRNGQGGPGGPGGSPGSGAVGSEGPLTGEKVAEVKEPVRKEGDALAK